MFAVGFIGPSGVGKTTLMEKVLARLIDRGRSVSAVKSSHHDTDVDKPGKDSWRYRTAGASEFVLVGPVRWAIMHETREPASLEEMLARLTPVDIVLVVGFMGEEGFPRILVHRHGYDLPQELVDGVMAVATDDEALRLPEGVTRLDINSPGAVANFVVTLKADSDHL